LERPNSNVAGGAATVPGAIQLDQIDVQGAGNPNSTMTPMPEYAGGQVATGGQVGLLGNRNVMDTPFNQTSYTQKTIQNQQARTVQDVMLTDPSATLGSSPDTGAQSTRIRGFPDGVTFNGLPDIIPDESAEFLERVEVLKGPSALLNGMPADGGAIGGSVNLVPKRAPEEPLTQLTTNYRSRSQLGTHLDVGRRFGDNKEFGVRFNGVYRNGGGPIDPSKSEVGLAALGLDYRGQRVRVSTDLGYLQADLNSAARFIDLAEGIAVPRPPDASKNFSPPWTRFASKTLFGTIQGEVDLTDNITAYAAFGAADAQRTDFTYVNPFVTNALGDWSSRATNQQGYTKTWAGQAGLRTSFDTGPVHHALSFNVAQIEQESGDARVNGSTSVFSNLYNPAFIPDPNLRAGDPRKTSEAKRSSVGVADTLSIFDKRIQLTVGVRRQQVEARNFDTTTGAATDNYNTYAWTPAYTLVVKPWENVSLYANHIEGLEQGAIVGPNFANAGTIFPPYQTKQYEAGMKVDWGRITTTVSAFQIARPSLINIPGTPLPTRALNGEQINRGVELNVFGELTEGVRLLGGAMFLDARLAKTANGTFDGNKAPGSPDINFVLGGEWDTPFVRGLTMTGRVYHYTSTFYDQGNTQKVPAWTRVDLGARYTFDAPWNNKPITIRFDVQNLFDHDYWLNAGLGLSLAPPRTFLLSTTFNF
jgi:iron complex outermembrane receptor protein